MNERIIIGEGERAGLPISAPLKDSSQASRIRWIQRENSFSLQQFRVDHWEDVPVVKEEQ